MRQVFVIELHYCVWPYEIGDTGREAWLSLIRKRRESHPSERHGYSCPNEIGIASRVSTVIPSRMNEVMPLEFAVGIHGRGSQAIVSE